ncbi:MAG: DUF2516 family protein [Dermatophilaceae bacterium]
MGSFGLFQNYVLLALGAIALAMEVFAFVDALRHPEAVYAAAGKRTRTFWLLLLGACLAVGIVTVFNVLNLFGLLAFMGAAVYLADVRPAVRQLRGRGGSGRSW